MKKVLFSFPAVIIISLGIQFFGLIRSLVLARDFGANSILDAFYLANVFTISVFSIVGSAVTTIVIPELNSAKSKESKRKYITSYLNFISIISVLVSILLLGLLFWGRQIIVPKFNYELQIIFILITFLLLISQQFRIQASFSIAVFQNEGHYILPRFMELIPASLPVFYLLFTKHSNIIVLSLITACSYVFETLFLNIIQRNVNNNYSFSGHIYWTDDLKKMLKRTVPIFLSSAIFQVQIMISNYFAGTFGQGYITLLSNTNQIMGIFQSLFILNLVNMIYPKLVREIKKNISAGLKKMASYITFTNMIVIILVWGYFAVGQDLVKLMFVRGAFTLANANIVFKYSVILGIVLPFTVIRDYHYRLFYSIGNTKKPMLNSIQTVIFNLVVLFVGAPILHNYVIVIAPALGTIWSCINVILKARKDGLKTDILRIFVGYLSSNVIGISMYAFIDYINFKSDVLSIELIVNILIGAVFISAIFVVIFAFYKLIIIRRHAK